MQKGYALFVIMLLTIIIFSSACVQRTITIHEKQELSSINSPVTASSSVLKQPEDNDGLSLEEEQKYGTDPSNPDTDEDGISDGDEVYEYHTNPLKADSDEDGLTDWKEIFDYGTNPLDSDTDGDGLYDGTEWERGTNPTLRDTDGDNITDGDEVNLYQTNPLSKDTDGDTLTDYEEIFVYNTSPISEDSDDDGISDSEELQLKTNPLKKDTDNDGLWDGEELTKYHTDPLNPDSDDDGLLDGQEIIDFQTNPLEADTDKDYLPDGYEVEIGTDPTYDWRDSYNTEAFKSGLSRLLRKEVSSISKQFTKYNTTIDKAWAILKWIDENIQYNYTKADYVDTIVFNWSTLSEQERELYNNLTKLQAANDTIYHYKSGICGDYAILTATLLLESNVSPIYMLDITYKNKEVGHATVAIKIDGEYFVLDQHLPLMPIGDYYWDSIKNENEISNMTFYTIKLNKNREPIVYSNWTWTEKQIKERTYRMTEKDVKLIINLTKQEFLELYSNYKEDERLGKVVEKHMKSIKTTNKTAKTSLPYGFTKGWVLWWSDEYFGLYYHPIIAEKLIEEYWPVPAFLEDDWREAIKQCNKFYLLVDVDENNKIMLRDSTGDTFEIPRIIMVMEIAK